MSRCKARSRGSLITKLPVLAFLMLTIAGAEAQFDKPPQPPLFIKKLDQEVKLEYGPLHRFVLECSASAEPLPKYSWFKNGKPFTDVTDEGIKMLTDDDHSQLDFNSPAPNHEGYYHCVAENDHGVAKSTVVHVTSNAGGRPPKGTRPPKFIRSPEVEVLRAGNTARFQCEASGKPEPTVVWTKNGVVMEGETGTGLVIHDIGPFDVANYACNASNVAGYEYSDTYLNILTVNAVITAGPEDLIVSKGSNVSMKCETDGYPQPTIQWLLNDTVLTASDKHIIRSDSASLLIMNADITDEGSYTCVASNQGEARRTGSLVVKSKTEIINGPRAQTIRVFESTVMNCSVVSDLSEKLTVVWKKNNVDLGNVDLGERVFQDENYNLKLNNVSLSDEGTYTCVAYTESTISNPATDSGYLTVSGIAPVLADIEDIPEQIEGSGDVRIACEVLEGYGTPTINWFKDGLPVEPSSTVLVDHNVLTLKDTRPDMSGEYTCQVVNPWGKDRRGVQVWIRQKTKILTEPVYVAYSSGTSVQLNCNIQVDPSLLDTLVIEWFRGTELLSPVMHFADMPPDEGAMEDDYDYASTNDNRYTMYENYTLDIKDLSREDVGLYKCAASTALEPAGSLRSQSSEIYIKSEFPFWIIILICLIALVLCVIAFIIYRIRRRSKGKGYYGVKDIEQNGGAAATPKHNKSDIYYTTEDSDSIMLEQDNVPFKEVSNGGRNLPAKPPMFTPKTLRNLAAMDKSTGSCGSLLDDDFLKRGMDEDGSFRERYAD